MGQMPQKHCPFFSWSNMRIYTFGIVIVALLLMYRIGYDNGYKQGWDDSVVRCDAGGRHTHDDR